MNKIKVLMLAGDGESTRLVYNRIKDDFLIEKVIIERAIPRNRFLKKRIKSLGLLKVIGQLAFVGYNFFLKKISKKRINEIKNNNNLNDEKIDIKLVSRVNSINSYDTILLLKKFKPDVIIVNGTRIIHKDVIEAIEAPFVNTHVGITPKYRGVHGGYWALTENDLENCGVTVHLIDTGIDTGGVLYQSTIEIIERDNFNTYPYLQLAAAIPLMIKAIYDIANNTSRIQKVDLVSKLWSHPTLFEYMKKRFFLGVK